MSNAENEGNAHFRGGEVRLRRKKCNNRLNKVK